MPEAETFFIEYSLSSLLSFFKGSGLEGRPAADHYLKAKGNSSTRASEMNPSALLS